MKNALILHGTDASPDFNWFPWLKRKLEAESYSVWVPLLPGNHTPTRDVYNDFLLESDFDFNGSLVVGHSSGAVSVLNLLMDPRMPHIKTAVIVSAWAGEKPNGYETNEQFENLFPPEGFDFTTIRQKADTIIFMHGDDDPYCPLERAQYLAGQLHSSMVVIPNGGHLGSKYTELPELWDVLKKVM